MNALMTLKGVVGRSGFSMPINLEAAAGTTLGIAGKNGVGKSTLLHTIAGLQPLQSGELVWNNNMWDAPSDGIFVQPEDRSCGVVFQDVRLFPHMTALKNVMFGLRAHGLSKEESAHRASEWLNRVGVSPVAHQRAATLSGGQAQRVALARALVAQPRVLLMDEPLSAIDEESRAPLRDLISAVLQGFTGVAIIVSHHHEDLLSLTQVQMDL